MLWRHRLGIWQEGSMVASSSIRTPAQEIAERQIETFTQLYGFEALEFACHAAFPMTLTTDLVYCLRQQFGGLADWSIAPALLLSDLCDGVGNDLYEMPISVRYCLLERLLKGDDGDLRLNQVADYMAEYIRYRVVRDREMTAIFYGWPTRWISLAMLKQDQELTEIIEAQIAEYVQDGTLSKPERLRLAAMLRGQADLFSEKQFKPIALRELEQRVRRGDVIKPANDIKSLRQAMAAVGFPELKIAQIEYAKITFEAKPQTEGTLQSFTFETVTVDRQGKVIAKSPQVAQAYTETLPEGLNLEMVAIPSGKFIMGSPDFEPQRYDDEGPQHEVTVPPFFMGKYAVTQAQWRLVAGLPQVERELDDFDPVNFKGADHPVEQVSWLDAEEFCLRLSVVTGREYRLPSEAQWEYACRAGTTTPFHYGETITGKIANYSSDTVYREEKKVKSRGGTNAVGSFPPNQFGLYDLHGNVLEWCMDDWHGNYNGAPNNGSAWVKTAETASRKVIRGGSWNDDPRYCRSASRNYYSRGPRYYRIGFRVVCCAPSSLA
jgi:formylglycine-generating enzyme required for sulfatase activity